MNRLLLSAGLVAGSVAFATTSTLAQDVGDEVLLAYFNFNTVPEGGFTPGVAIPANGGLFQATAFIDTSDFTGGVTNFAGSTINALGGDVAGQALALQGGVGGSGSVTVDETGSFIEISGFSLVGLENLDVSFATRGTSTGFDSGQLSISTDGGLTFTDFGGNLATRSTTFQLSEATTSLGNNAASPILRYTVAGATTAAGNNRIDNLQISATVIPEPATAGLLGLAGLTLLARRRRA